MVWRSEEPPGTPSCGCSAPRTVSQCALPSPLLFVPQRCHLAETAVGLTIATWSAEQGGPEARTVLRRLCLRAGSLRVWKFWERYSAGEDISLPQGPEYSNGTNHPPTLRIRASSHPHLQMFELLLPI